MSNTEPRKPTRNERFFEHDVYVLVGDSAAGAFPKLSRDNLLALGKTLYAVDLGFDAAKSDTIATGQPLTSLAAIPEGDLDAAIIELPKERVLAVVEELAGRGVGRFWVHQGKDTPELHAYCKGREVELHTGTCAVMYTQRGFSYHSLHKWVMKLRGKY